MAVEFTNRAFDIIDAAVRCLLVDPSETIMDDSITRLTSLLRNVRRMSSAYQEMTRLCGIVEGLIRSIEDRKSSTYPSVRFFAAQQQSTRGRPLYVISREQLEYFVETGFTRKHMARMLQVSESSIKRRLRHFGLSLRRTYSTLGNDELDLMVREITQDNQSLGQRMVQGILQSRGHRVQRQRVADSLIRVDEAAVALRWCQSVRRRVYKVAGPNSLWHIDGNHKLIRWGFVIHGGIDGFSRMCVFMKVATNNLATTMTRAFMSGVHSYGIPSRVRSDKGLENTGVGAFMLAQRGPRRGSFITGKSVHNQRIERLWRDMFTGCTGVFHRLFYHMEETGILNVSDEVHLQCLHYVFLPRIQRSLDAFREGWNCHRMSEERGMSPTQLFIQGMVERAGQGHQGVDDIILNDMSEEDFGVEEEGLVATDENNSDMPQLSQTLSQPVLQQLSTINPLDGQGLGTEIYIAAIDIVNGS